MRPAEGIFWAAEVTKKRGAEKRRARMQQSTSGAALQYTKLVCLLGGEPLLSECCAREFFESDDVT